MDPLQQQDPNMMPPDPAMGAAMPTPSASSDMTPEEMTANLEKLMSAINDKMNTFNGQKAVSESQMTQSQNDAIAALFDILTKNGIDPADPNAISAFLEQLKQENPDGYQIFEDSINSLLGQKGALDKMGPPDNFAEPAAPLAPMGQLGQEPKSPPGLDLNLPMNQLPPIPGVPGRG